MHRPRHRPTTRLRTLQPTAALTCSMSSDNVAATQKCISDANCLNDNDVTCVCALVVAECFWKHSPCSASKPGFAEQCKRTKKLMEDSGIECSMSCDFSGTNDGNKDKNESDGKEDGGASTTVAICASAAVLVSAAGIFYVKRKRTSALSGADDLVPGSGLQFQVINPSRNKISNKVET